MNEQEVLSIQSEAGFKALFEYATIGILVISSKGDIELANPCVEKLFDYSPDELIGKPVEILIPAAFKQKHVQHREGYFNKPKARSMGYGLNLFARKKDGYEFPVEISLGHYQFGSEKLAVAFITDITEKKRSHEELEAKVKERTLELTESLEREKDHNEMKSRFVSMASHEFRTPLSAILSSVSLIDSYSKEEDAEKRKKHVERVKSSVKNLTDILNNFLSLDKLQQGKIELISEPFDIHDFSRDIMEEVNGMLRPGQQIIFTHDGEREVNRDRRILKNVLLNILSNAIKYSFENQSIFLNVQVANHHVSIQVRDEGMGIPHDEQKNLFDKFFRAKNVTNIQGTGLGLNIVKKYVELLDGTIHFSSAPGEGTTFTIEFPQD